MSNDFHERDNALNQRLQQLVEEARQYPANGSSTERVRRRIALNNLEDEISESEQIKEIIENDPEGFLKNEQIQGHPQANLQAILLLILERKRWKEISQELDVPMSTAASFYQRRVRKIIAYVKKYI